MKKKVWLIVLLIVLALIMYGLPIIGVIISIMNENKSLSFKVENDVIIVDKDKLEISDVKNFYDEESKTYYVIGNLKNKTNKVYDEINLTYRCYDKENTILGETSAILNNVEKKSTWKYKVGYYEIDANEVERCELTSINEYKY